MNDAVIDGASERYRMLQQACEQAIQVIRRDLEETDLQRYFPHLADNPALVSRSARQSSEFWAQNVLPAVTSRIDNEKIEPKLETLLRLEEDARNRRYRHQTGSADPRDQPVDAAKLTASDFMELRLQQQKVAYNAELQARRDRVIKERAELEQAAQEKLAQLSEILQKIRQ